MLFSKLQNKAASSKMELPKIELPKTRFSEDLGGSHFIAFGSPALRFHENKIFSKFSQWPLTRMIRVNDIECFSPKFCWYIFKWIQSTTAQKLTTVDDIECFCRSFADIFKINSVNDRSKIDYSRWHWMFFVEVLLIHHVWNCSCQW